MTNKLLRYTIIMLQDYVCDLEDSMQFAKGSKAYYKMKITEVENLISTLKALKGE